MGRQGWDQVVVERGSDLGLLPTASSPDHILEASLEVSDMHEADVAERLALVWQFLLVESSEE